MTDTPADGITEERDLRHRGVALVTDLRRRYQISALEPLLDSCRAALQRTDLSVGVLGRFKAGKSSFLNQLAGRTVLPVGVTPVTAVVTDLAGGQTDSAVVRYSDGRESAIRLDEIPQFVSEAENADNRRGVISLSVRVPELMRFGNIRLFDTPGLDSAFVHNTEASRQWAPHVDVALVAVAVDPPLSQQDLALIRRLLDYTPRVTVLLTKFDLLGPEEQVQVLQFVKEQLAKNIDEPIDVFPYSIRAGYEYLSRSFEIELIARLSREISDARNAVANRKIRTLVRECGDYLRLSLKAAELLDSERSELRVQASLEKNALADTRLELRLIASHAIAGCRPTIRNALAPEEIPVRRNLQADLEQAVASYPSGLDKMIAAFQSWLEAALSARLGEVSDAKKAEFLQPLFDVERQYAHLLQSFRDRLSDRVAAAYGVPLRTTEPDIIVEPPKAPDVRIGRIFDHNWELLSPILPMALLRHAVFRRFRGKVRDETFKNISRLTTQWEDIVSAAILRLQGEAERRLEDLVSTVDRLTSAAPAEAQRIREDLGLLDAVEQRLAKAG